MRDIDLTMDRILTDKPERDVFSTRRPGTFRIRTVGDSLLWEEQIEYPWTVPTVADQRNAFGFTPYHEHYGPYMSKPGTTCDRCGKELTVWDFYTLCYECESPHERGFGFGSALRDVFN